MSGGLYGGDEVGAIVLDPGHFSLRAGYAGEEWPKAEIPSSIGVIPEDGGRRYAIDTLSTQTPIPGMEMETYLKDGMIEDWDMFENLLDYTYKRYLAAQPPEHPVLISEPPWNVKSSRERLAELMFEKQTVPALFVAKNAVLAAFASGKSTALVIDSGASQTSATPVYDGYCYGQAVVKSSLAGDALANQCKLAVEQMGLPLVASYQVASKTAVEPDTPSKWTKKTNLPPVTNSFHQFQLNQTLRDMAASVLQVSDSPFNQEAAEKLPAALYEFPDGAGREFVAERMKIPEGLFDISFLQGLGAGESGALLSVPQVALTSIGMSDVDMRPALYGGVVVTGGNSLVQGFTERLTHELQAKCPSSARLKLLAPPMPSERRFGAWIGGSILASLGSFHNMWISKQEWEENGKLILEKKCP